MAYVSWPAMMGIDNVGSASVFLVRGLFETAHDLDCRFFGIRRPYTVTDVLTRCLKRPTNEAYSNDELWAWTLPQRLQGLVAVVTACRQSTIQVLEQCPSCGETAELELNLASFVDTNMVRELSIELEPGICLVVAIPTGQHQLEWLRTTDNLSDENHSLKMATTLTQSINGEQPATDWCPPRQWLDKIQAALDENDPLTALSLSVECPSCSEPMDVELDLEAQLLMKLELSQKEVLEEIYYLARAYHWTEAEIINMPAWRRRFYMHRCQQEMRL